MKLGRTTPDPLSRGLTPNNTPQKQGMRRLGKGAAIMFGAAALIAGAVFVNGLVKRTGKDQSQPSDQATKTSDQPLGGAASAGGNALITSLSSAAASAPRQKPRVTPPPTSQPNQPLQHQPKPVLADKAPQTPSPAQQLVQQAWMQYVSGVIQQTAKLNDERRQALAAGLGSGAGREDSRGLKVPGALSPTPVSFNGGQNPLAGMFGGSGAGGSSDGGVSGSPISFTGSTGANNASAAAAQKSSYLGKLRGNPDYLPAVRQAPVSRDVLRAGTVIPAEMETGIDSELPGQILARVTANVLNTPDGTQVLVPQGATLVGTYDNQVSNGQSRVLVVWNRIIFPDGSSLDIASMPGADPSGFAGFHDQVDNHYFRVFGDALLLSVFSAGVQLSQPQAAPNSVYSSQQVVAGSLGQQLGQTGQNLINRDINIAPTLKIRPGYRFNVMITRDLVIRPWQPVSRLADEAGADNAPQTTAPMWIAEPLQQNHLAHGGLVKVNASTAGAKAPISLFTGKPVAIAPLPLPPQAAPIVAAPPPPPPLPTWSLNAGSLIGRQIERWGASAGWHVIWNVGEDWPVPRRADFHGGFAAAAGQVIEDMAAQGAAIHATFYRGNHTLVIEGTSQ